MNDETGQVGLIPDTQFVDNTNQRTPCVLVLDGSTSMEGAPINNLNQGLAELEQALKNDPTASSRVQVLVIRAGGLSEAEVISDWTDVLEFSAPKIEANGTTPLGAAMNLALAKVEEQKESYRANGIPYTRPWIFLISDGDPTDNWEAAAQACQDAEANKKVVVWPIGAGGSNLETLGQFTSPGRGAMRLKGIQFRELFQWVSSSLQAASRSKEGEKVQLPDVSAWAETEL